MSVETLASVVPGVSRVPAADGRVVRSAGDARDARRRDFAAALAQRRDAQATGPVVDNEARARSAAEDFVSAAFVQPVLKALRSSDRTEAPWGAGPAEKQLRSLTDVMTATQLVRSSNWPLVDRLARDLLRVGKPARAPSSVGGQGGTIDVTAQ
jgi:hypothetical protein